MWDRVSEARKKKAREFGHGDQEIARSDIPTAGGSVGHSGVRVEYRWHETSGSHREKSRSIGVRIHESRSAESKVRVDAW
jgi:hypothetical protein